MITQGHCENCPLVLDCADFAAEQRTLAQSYDIHIKREETEPGRILDTIDRLGIILDERVSELTYETMASLSDEEAETLHQEKKDRDKLLRSFEEITLHGISGVRVQLYRNLQAIYLRIAEASESYAQELQDNCRLGVGKYRSFGLIGTKHLYCRSSGKVPNLDYFIWSARFQELDGELQSAHADIHASYMRPEELDDNTSA